MLALEEKEQRDTCCDKTPEADSDNPLDPSDFRRPSRRVLRTLIDAINSKT
jgi:hypothetical protein